MGGIENVCAYLNLAVLPSRTKVKETDIFTYLNINQEFIIATLPFRTARIIIEYIRSNLNVYYFCPTAKLCNPSYTILKSSLKH